MLSDRQQMPGIARLVNKMGDRFKHSTVPIVRLDIEKTMECNLDFLSVEVGRNLFARKYHGIDAHDIMYEEILSDPLSVVKKFYVKFGIELSPVTEAKMKAFIRKNRQHKHGHHKYSVSDFGMTEAQIIERFEEYMNQFAYKA